MVKKLPANAAVVGSILGPGISPIEGNGNPLQYSCQANPAERGSVEGYSPWGRKRLRHDLVTKQQQSRQQTDPSYSTDTFIKNQTTSWYKTKNIGRRNICVHVLSHFSPVQIFATQWTIANQAPLSLGFSRQEYWSKLSCPPPEDLSDPEIEPAFLMSPALSGRFFTTRATWEAPRILVFIPISLTKTCWIWCLKSMS